MYWSTTNVQAAAGSAKRAAERVDDSDIEPERDLFNLDRFVEAQDANGTFKNVLAALREGRRKPQPSTWMWFVFPQMDKCLTRERRPDRREKDVWPRDQALVSLDEARAYLNHPILGPRLREAAHAVLNSPFTDKYTVMDNIFLDTERLHSSMTIFRQAARYPTCLHDVCHYLGENTVFRQVLNRYFVDMDSDDEDDILDEGNRELLKTLHGRRHKATITRLDALEVEAIERRLEQRKGCVCGRSPEELVFLDKASREKVMLSGQSREARAMRPRVTMVCNGQDPTHDATRKMT